MGEVEDRAARAAEQQALAAKRARKASIVRRLVADGAGNQPLVGDLRFRIHIHRPVVA